MERLASTLSIITEQRFLEKSVYLSLFQFLLAEFSSARLVDLFNTPEKKKIRATIRIAAQHTPTSQDVYDLFHRQHYLLTPSSNSWFFGSCFKPA
jgi:hypothetical protein